MFRFNEGGNVSKLFINCVGYCANKVFFPRRPHKMESGNTYGLQTVIPNRSHTHTHTHTQVWLHQCGRHTHTHTQVWLHQCGRHTHTHTHTSLASSVCQTHTHTHTSLASSVWQTHTHTHTMDVFFYFTELTSMPERSSHYKTYISRC